MVVVTSSARHEVETLLALVDAAEAIIAVTTIDDIDRSKPHPDALEVAIERTGLDRARIVVVGDSVWDVTAAARAGLRSIGVETGGIRRHELLGAGAAEVAPGVADLLGDFHGSLLATL